MEELNYFLLSETAWNKLTSWYGLEEQSTVIARKVVEHGMYMRHCKVEVYRLEFKLTIYPNIDDFKYHSFSQGDTVEYLEAALKKEFEVEEDAECRVWHRFMTHTYELLSNRSQTLQDVGLYNGQVKLLDYYHLFICLFNMIDNFVREEK
jgi:ubiquitin carboxyl-terminal hydrolase 4/11/15